MPLKAGSILNVCVVFMLAFTWLSFNAHRCVCSLRIELSVAYCPLPSAG